MYLKNVGPAEWIEGVQHSNLDYVIEPRVHPVRVLLLCETQGARTHDDAMRLQRFQ